MEQGVNDNCDNDLGTIGALRGASWRGLRGKWCAARMRCAEKTRDSDGDY